MSKALPYMCLAADPVKAQKKQDLAKSKTLKSAHANYHVEESEDSPIENAGVTSETPRVNPIQKAQAKSVRH